MATLFYSVLPAHLWLFFNSQRKTCPASPATLFSAFRALFGSCQVALEEMPPLACWSLSPHLEYLPEATSDTPRLLTCSWWSFRWLSMTDYCWRRFCQGEDVGLDRCGYAVGTGRTLSQWGVDCFIWEGSHRPYWRLLHTWLTGG